MKNSGDIMPRAQKRNYLLFTIAIFAAFTIFGFSENVKGPAIPRMQEDFSITELQLGLLLAVNSIGYLLACSYTARLAKRIGIKTCMITALCVMAISGVCIFLTQSYGALVLSYFVLYLGNGMLEIALGIISATTFTKNTGTMMNLAHFFYGAGSMFSPVVSAGIMAARFGGVPLGWRYMYLIVLGCALIPAIPAMLGHLDKQDYNRKKSGYKTLLKNPTVWLVLLVLSFGCTCEMGVGAWFANFLEKTHSFPAERAALMLTLFFAVFTLSRLVLGPLIDRFGLINSLAAATAFAGTATVAGVLLGENGTVLLVIAGAGVSPIYPTAMAVIAKLFADEIDLAVTAIMSLMGIFIVFADIALGGIVYAARQIFTGMYGDEGVGMAYSSGYLFLGLCCFGAFFAAMALKRRQKKLGAVV